VVICLEQGADLHMAQLMPLPLTVSCFSKIQIGFTFPVPAQLGSPEKKVVKWVCVCVSYFLFLDQHLKIYRTDLCQVCSVGKTTAADDRSEISFSTTSLQRRCHDKHFLLAVSTELSSGDIR